jgi:hypothetical protein
MTVINSAIRWPKNLTKGMERKIKKNALNQKKNKRSSRF